MNWQLLVFGLLPLIVFVVVDAFASFKVAVIAATIVAVAEAIFSYFYFGEVDEITWISLGLIVVLGFIAYKLDNSKIFKFQPVILAGITALILAYFQFFDEPLLLKFIPKVKPFLPEEKQKMFEDPRVIAFYGRVSLHLIPTFLLHGALTAYAALRMSNTAWLIVRGVGIYVLLGLVFLFNLTSLQ